MGHGHFILSLDVELAWGTFDHGGLDKYADQLKAERDVIRRLLAELDRYSIPATFAMVGHLLLSSCRRDGATTHADVLRPRYPWFGRDWHCLDPATDVQRDPLWYGTDILDWIRNAVEPHEIGTHTFSHVVAGDPACTAEIMSSQIAACQALHTQHGLPPLKSIVFPRNSVAHLDVLKKLGLIAFRGQERSWYRGTSGPLRRACHLADRAAALPPPTYSLVDRGQGGLVDLPASMFLLPREGARRFVPLASRQRQASLGLRRAAERGEVFHLWFHPFNLASDLRLFDVLVATFHQVAELADQGHLTPITMGSLAERLLSRGGSS